jgi:hypothetical protein
LWICNKNSGRAFVITGPGTNCASFIPEKIRYFSMYYKNLVKSRQDFRAKRKNQWVGSRL